MKLLILLVIISPVAAFYALSRYASARKRIIFMEENYISKKRYQELEKKYQEKIAELQQTAVNPQTMTYEQLKECVNYFAHTYPE